MRKKIIFSNLFCFTTNERYYLFNAFTNTIYRITEGVWNLLQSNCNEIRNYPKSMRKLIKETMLKKKRVFVEPKQEVALVTINPSTKCNLNCEYCFRNKNSTKNLTKQDLYNIVKYTKEKYMPDAKEYSFSLCLTSESTLELELLEYFDKLIAENEGYLFSPESFIKDPIELFKVLPESIKEKYKNSNQSMISVLNKILMNEKLYLLFENNNSYIKSVLSFSTILSTAITTRLNRIILMEKFPYLIKQESVKYMSMFFMTNATLISPKIIEFMKSVYMQHITLSIDGNENSNDINRKTLNNKGSYKAVEKGIKLLKDNNFIVNASVVLNIYNNNFIELCEHLISLGVDTISFNLVRGGCSCSFSLEQLDKLLTSISQMYELILLEAINKKFYFTNLLRKSLFFEAIKTIDNNEYQINRCQFGNKISISPEGKIYHCDYLNFNEKDYQGLYTDNISYDKTHVFMLVDNSDICSNCWAKYLCGGTCYAQNIIHNQEIDEIECVFRKKLIEHQIKLISKLYETDSYESFIQTIKKEE